MPRRSFVSPWAVMSPKDEAIVRRQGRLREAFVQEVIEKLWTYLEPPENPV